jgi:hypothetical protein
MKSVQIILVVLAAVCSSSMATMAEGDVPQVNALSEQESRFGASIEALNEEEVSNASVSSCHKENIVWHSTHQTVFVRAPPHCCFSLMAIGNSHHRSPPRLPRSNRQRLLRSSRQRHLPSSRQRHQLSPRVAASSFQMIRKKDPILYYISVTRKMVTTRSK